MSQVKHEIVIDAAGVMRIDGKEEDLAAALPRFSAEAEQAGAPVLVRTVEASREPSLFLVAPDGSLTPVDEEPTSSFTLISDVPAAAPVSDTSPAAPIEVASAVDAGGAAEAIASGAPAQSNRVSRFRRFVSRRPVLIGAGIVAAVAIGMSATWLVTNSAAGTPSATPTPTVSPAHTVVTLPGWSTKPAWSAGDIDTAAAFGGHVIGLAGDKATVWEAETGREVSTATLTGPNPRVLTGTVDTFVALAAVSDTQALVWVDGKTLQTIPLASPDGTAHRALETRTGTFFLTGPDRTFWLVTRTGDVPLTAPGPQLIVLGGDADQIRWASGAGHVISASPNGTVLSDATLQPPATGAMVTPKTGWLRASTKAVTVVGWTLPDGQMVTGIHDTKTGALLGTIPGPGKGLFAGDSAVIDGQRISLLDGNATPLPAGFIPSSYLGSNLLGAMADGGDAILPTRKETPLPATGTTVRPVAVAGPHGKDFLVTLTGRNLAVYPPTK